MGAAAASAAGSVLGGVAQGYGQKKAAEAQADASRYSSDVQKAIADRQFQAEQALTPLQIAQQNQMANSYRSAYGEAQGNQGVGREELLQQYAQTPEELEILKNNLLTGQSEALQQGTSQLESALAQSGVRGGQAATQLRRGIGDITKQGTMNIQNLIAQDALQRSGEERSFRSAEQQALQNFLLNPTSAQYSQALSPEQMTEEQKLLEKYLAIK